MQKKLRLSPLSWFLVTVMVLLLVGVRLFEKTLFYDPFIIFFKYSKERALPEYDAVKLFINYFMRYGFNSLISLAVLWILFRDKTILRLTSVLYVVFFIVLAILLFVVLQTETPSQKLIFYLRRFIIQPLLLLLFIPAFYFQKYVKQ